MNRTLKIILILAGATLVLGLSMLAAGFIILRSAGWLFNNVVESEPASITQVGRAIAEYDVPDQFSEAYAADVAGFSMVAYHDRSTGGHLFLMQLPNSAELDPVSLEHQFRRASGTEALAEVAVVQHVPCRIRGQETTLVISEGFNHENEHYRSASALFNGKGGQALVNFSGPAAGWDQTLVETFVESLD